LWGTNTLTTNLHLWPFVTEGRRAGAPLVVVDPVRTRTAAQADRHLAPRPGTDAALALAVMARLVELGATDEAYLADRALGWPQFRDEVLSRWTTARGDEVCGLEQSEIAWFADAIATHSPLGIRALMGMQRHGGGAQAARAISCLPAVTGDYARLGGGMCYSTGPAYTFNSAALTRPDLQPGPTRRLQMSSLGRELLERTDPPVTVLMVWAANPVAANPDQHRTRAGLARDDLFTAVVEHRLTETCDYADLVLPGTTQLEHDDLVESYSHLYLQWNAAAVPPPGECRSHTEIFRALARELGVTEPAVHAGDDELVRAALEPGPHGDALAGITLESLRENGFERLSVSQPYLPFSDGFPTASGRFEFTSASAQAAGAGLMPGFTQPHESAPHESAPHGDGGLVLISAANHYLINSTFSHSRIHARAGVATVTVHPEDAAVRGLTDGATARVSNDRGGFEAVVRVSDAVRQGVAATTKATAVTTGSTGPTVNATTADRDSDLGHGATFHDNLLRITPA
jgi:anaerobic selenocysteine-containing dehydrogenase